MSDLSVAKKLVEAAGKVKGRTLEARFNDLRRAVERIIVHLEKFEKASQHQ